MIDCPDSTGSLGIAISEAVETAATSGGRYKYALGQPLSDPAFAEFEIDVPYAEYDSGGISGEKREKA